MAHLLMYSTNYTVCRLSACLRPHALRVHLQHHMIGSACRLSLMCDVRLPQALAEALTTSAKGMAGRRLLQCSDLSREIHIPSIPDPGFGVPNPFGRRLFSLPSRDAFGRELLTVGFESECNSIVNGFKAQWDAARIAAVDAVEKTARAAEAAATKLLNEVKDAAKAAAAAATKTLNEVKDAANVAAAAATSTLNEVKDAANVAAAAATSTLNEVTDAAEKAAATATNFIDDVGNAFSELGKEIQCAAPLPPPAPL